MSMEYTTAFDDGTPMTTRGVSPYVDPQPKIRFLRAGVDRIVHVIAKELHTGNPCIGIRNADDPEAVPSLKVHHAEIVVGTGTYIHIHRTPDNPVPGTDGRGICPLRTDAELKIYED